MTQLSDTYFLHKFINKYMVKENIIHAIKQVLICLINIQRRYRIYKCTKKAKRQVAKYGKGLTVNYSCSFSNTVYIGDYCNFNGMRANGGAKYFLEIISTVVQNV